MQSESRLDARDEALYSQLLGLLDNNAEHLKKLAILLYENRKNREFLSTASAELGRNATHIARAVKYFPFAFWDETLSTHEYQILFLYARLNLETAYDLYENLGTTMSLYDASQVVEKSKPRRDKKEPLANRIATHIKAIDNYKKDGAAAVLEEICKEPEISREL